VKFKRHVIFELYERTDIQTRSSQYSAPLPGPRERSNYRNIHCNILCCINSRTARMELQRICVI